MKKQQRLIVGVVLALLLVVFSLLNSQEVAVNFFGASFHWPLILVLLGTLLIGVVAALLVGGQRNKTADKELEELREALKKADADKEAAVADAKRTAEKSAGEEIARLKLQLKNTSDAPDSSDAN